MMTLLQSALTGWTDYTQHGKFAAFLLLAILYLGFVLYGASGAGAGKTRQGRILRKGMYGDGRPGKILYLYGVLITLGCICPVTALILLKYQTAFYSYVWIWAAVPQTALIAWAAADFLYNLLKERTLRNIMAAILLLGILFLGGNPVSEWGETQTAQIPALAAGNIPLRKQETSAWETLEQLTAYSEGERGTREFVLWAPKEVMAAARAYSAQIRPVYGRSIWDASLGSYSYETNEIWQEDLYLWMSHLEAVGETEYLRTEQNGEAEGAGTEPTGRKIDFATCLDRAEEVGIDYILLPGNLSEDARQTLQKTLGEELQSFGGYFLVVVSNVQ